MSRHHREALAVSVIVPVFNTGKYLQRCLDSLVTQALRDIEIIVVEDASTDETPDILRRYAAQDSRIRIGRRQQENQGLPVGRIDGVVASSRQYVAYVDSDDCAGTELLEVMYREALARRADIVRTGAWLLRQGDPFPPPDNGSPDVLRFAEHT
jgi:glycosyltransferase involved in cell wall biosynthesis